MNSTDLISSLNLISFIFTIISGTVSIALGVFALWLSRHFDEKSSCTLEKVNNLTTEIRALVNVSVTQQKDFSDKMLNSILSKDNYGESSESQKSALENVVQRQLEGIENNLLSNIDKKIDAIMSENKNGNVSLNLAIDRIRHDLKEITTKTTASASLKITIPQPLIENKERIYKQPAHVLVLTAIVKENIKSLDELAHYVDKYHFPEVGLQMGINNLLEWGILEGKPNEFSIPSQDELSYANWLDKNQNTINHLLDFFASKSDEPRIIELKDISRNLIFD